MIKVFLDTNIIVDLLAEREGFYLPSARLATLADQGKVVLVTSSVAFVTAHYILSKFDSKKGVLEKLRRFKVLCEIAPAGDKVIARALESDFPDFEDAVQYFCALESDCSVLLTRNMKDFRKAGIPVMSAAEFLTSRN